MTTPSGDASPIRVLLVDDQTLVRQGIRGLLDLADGVEVIGEAADGEQALDLLNSSADAQPDVVLLDLRMPGIGGLGVLARLAEQSDAPPVLVLTTFDDDHAVLESLRLGAKGFLLKDVTLADLTGAIRTVAAGGLHVRAAVTERMLRRAAIAAPSPNTLPASLTPRERDILRLVTGGFSNREIAAALHLAEGTVKNHVSNLLLKLGVRDRTRAALRGLELGLVGESPQ